MMEWHDVVQLLIAGAAATASAACVAFHLLLGWNSGHVQVDRFGWYTTMCSAGLTVGMVLTVAGVALRVRGDMHAAIIVWSLRDTLFTASMAGWAYYQWSLRTSGSKLTEVR